MERVIEHVKPVSECLQTIQNILDFHGWEQHHNFATAKGLGRVAFIATVLGVSWGFHGALFIIFGLQLLGMTSPGFFEGQRLQMASQYCFYMCSMSAFHLLEFFTTAVFNPTVTSSESFLVNHSKAYTAAFFISSLEFWVRFFFFPQGSTVAFLFGAILVAVSQAIRSWAMMTCGESFNHLIQISKKENHVLVKHGIYKYLRHPSYVGFYYWSIATQIVLNNWFSATFFAFASFMFFRRRIPYEEESLMEHFPEEYETYASTTWIGIPFIPNIIPSSRPSRQADVKND
jgi:protein-S-isoprenylcysteine O-methyltransferase